MLGVSARFDSGKNRFALYHKAGATKLNFAVYY